jgi:sulfatase modifying factor 1
MSDDLRRSDPIILPAEVRERLLATILQRLPRKSFGYLVSRSEPRRVDDFILLEGNIRNTEEWKGRFEAYGQYFMEHDDAGFVSTPEETWRVQKEIWKRGMTEVGLFHSHLRHPANFSGIDYDMHISRYPHLWHMIISMRNRTMPQVRIFNISSDGVREEKIAEGGVTSSIADPAEHSIDAAIAKARSFFALDGQGLPCLHNAEAIVRAIELLRKLNDPNIIDELVTRGLLAGSEKRLQQHILPLMKPLEGGLFQMGTATDRRRHFVGETPCRTIALSPFSITSVTVTNALFGLLDRRRLRFLKEDLLKPAVNVSWYEATLFALWVGCRLPMESEWEFACGAGSDGEWACKEEADLRRIAWYADNSRGIIRQPGQLESNSYGLHDMHGNVWEWCKDTYDQASYVQGGTIDPVHLGIIPTDKVCRGGSVDSLAEMCRTRYRICEPPGFFASDLGFRLARSRPLH